MPRRSAGYGGSVAVRRQCSATRNAGDRISGQRIVSTSAGRGRRIAKGLQEAGYIEVQNVPIEISLGGTTVMIAGSMAACHLSTSKQMARRGPAGAEVSERWIDASALLHCLRAARMEPTARGRLERARHLALD